MRCVAPFAIASSLLDNSKCCRYLLSELYTRIESHTTFTQQLSDRFVSRGRCAISTSHTRTAIARGEIDSTRSKWCVMCGNHRRELALKMLSHIVSFTSQQKHCLLVTTVRGPDGGILLDVPPWPPHMSSQV